MDSLELLQKLVDIPSPSGQEDELLHFISRYLEEKNMDYKIEGKNLVIDAQRDMWIVTHLDTVPKKMDFYFDGVYAYGTGVCDAKSSVAAILIALSEINSLNFGIALLCDEEEGGKGSLEFAKRYRGKAIVMEPTDFRIAVDHYGGIDVSVNIKGKASHGSYPEYGINAIDKAIEMTKKLNELKLPGKMSFIEIRGGDGQHVIPEECFLRIDFALPPKIKAEEFFTLVEGTLKEYGDFKIEEFYDGYEEDSFDLFEEALKRSDVSADYVEMHSWTDAINLKNAGWNAIVWGPGELYRCHTPLERVKLQEIEKASRVLVNFNEILK